MATDSLRIEVAMLLSHYSNSLFIVVPLSMANNNLPRRIIKETQRLLSEPAPGISASPSEDNMRYFNVPLFRSPLAKGLLLGSLPLSPYSDPFVFRQHCSCSANPILFKQPRFRSDLSYPLRSLRLEYSSMASASSSDAKSVYDFVVKHVQRPLQFFGPKTFLNLRTCPDNVIKDLRLSCHVITECSSDNSIVSAEGAFSNDWLKNLQTPLCPLVLDVENSYLRDRNALQFCAQPSSIPGSLLQLVGSSCLLRATAWEI